MLAPPRGGLRPAAGQHGDTIVYPATRGGSAELGYPMVDRCVSGNERWARRARIHDWSTVVYPASRGGLAGLGNTMVVRCVSRSQKEGLVRRIRNGRPRVRAGPAVRREPGAAAIESALVAREREPPEQRSSRP